MQHFAQIIENARVRRHVRHRAVVDDASAADVAAAPASFLNQQRPRAVVPRLEPPLEVPIADAARHVAQFPAGAARPAHIGDFRQQRRNCPPGQRKQLLVVRRRTEANQRLVKGRVRHADALAVAEKYALRLSDTARGLLAQETPKTADNVTVRVTGSVRELCAAAAKACRDLGYTPEILTDCEQGVAREVGARLDALARENVSCGTPRAFILGGETVVRLTGNGKGGRNQELALAAAAEIAGAENVVVFSVGSDGTDGPTDAAGGLVDGGTVERLAAAGKTVADVLQNNDAYHALRDTGDLIITGPTGTNVNDFAAALVR